MVDFFFSKYVWESEKKKNQYLTELKKCLFSALYLVVGGTLQSIGSQIILFNLPDKDRFQYPLEDVLLDRLPSIRAFHKFEENFSVIFAFCFTALVVFHKQRFEIFRRYTICQGILCALRSVSILVTKLPVPNPDYAFSNCYTLEKKTFLEHVIQMFNVVLKIGFSTHGVTLCGDLIFSGHTGMVVLLLLFSFYYIRFKNNFFTWLMRISLTFLSMIAVVCILIARFHYTIDVLLAFYITIFLFYTHHFLSENIKTTKMVSIIPFLKFFEDGSMKVEIKENETVFSNPLRDIPIVKKKEE